jgi:salicylate hydroxylase
VDAKALIAGAGLGGLTAAACLLQAGFDVEVYEQAPALGEIGAGIQQSANAMHVMRHLGLLERLVDVGFQPPVTEFRIYNTGEVLQALSLAQAHWERHGAPYLQLHRADFHAILAGRVRELKSDAIHLNAAVTGFEESAGTVTLRLADGRRIGGDLLVGADGIKSPVRAQIAGETPADYTGDAAWRLTVPTSRFPPGFLGRKSSIWVGPDKHAVVYFVRGGALLNFVGAVELDEWIEESWTLRRPWAELKTDFEGWHGDVQAIIDAADRDQCYRWSLNARPALTNWSTGRATLIGDAAHPTLPYMAQGAAMAVEDAAVLTRALEMSNSVPAALRLYQHNRIERTTRIVDEAHANRGLFHLDSIEALKAAFAKRNMDQERSNWLYSYNPLTVEMSVLAD